MAACLCKSFKMPSAWITMFKRQSQASPKHCSPAWLQKSSIVQAKKLRSWVIRGALKVLRSQSAKAIQALLVRAGLPVSARLSHLPAAAAMKMRKTVHAPQKSRQGVQCTRIQRCPSCLVIYLVISGLGLRVQRGPQQGTLLFGGIHAAVMIANPIKGQVHKPAGTHSFRSTQHRRCLADKTGWQSLFGILWGRLVGQMRLTCKYSERIARAGATARKRVQGGALHQNWVLYCRDELQKAAILCRHSLNSSRCCQGLGQVGIGNLPFLLIYHDCLVLATAEFESPHGCSSDRASTFRSGKPC